MNDFDFRDNAWLDIVVPSLSSVDPRTEQMTKWIWPSHESHHNHRHRPVSAFSTEVTHSYQAQWSVTGEDYEGEPSLDSGEYHRGQSPDPSTSSSSHGGCSAAPSLKKHSKLGRRGDPRMHLAMAARLSDPHIPLLEALVRGGFVFVGLGEPGASDRSIRDEEGILLYQRKNQLNRRLRMAKKKKPAMEERERSKKAKKTDKALRRTKSAACHSEEKTSVASSAAAPTAAAAVVEEAPENSEIPDFFEIMDDDERYFCPPLPATQQPSRYLRQASAPHAGSMPASSFDAFFLSLPEDLERDMVGSAPDGHLLSQIEEDDLLAMPLPSSPSHRAANCERELMPSLLRQQAQLLCL